MKEFLYNNSESFLNETKYSYQNFAIALTICLSVLFFCSCIFKISDIYEVKGVYKKETQVIQILWPFETINKFSTFEKVKIKNNIASIEIQNMSEVLLDEEKLKNYQIIEIKTKEELLDNQIVTIELMNKKEIIIKKIIYKIIGKE